MGSILLHGECLVVDLLVALAVVGTGVQVTYRLATSGKASEAEATAAIADLAAAKATNEDLKRAYRVELCRYFLPIIAGFPDQAHPKQMVMHYVADNILPDISLTKRELRACERCTEAMAVLLDGHPNPFNKESTVRLTNELHLRSFAELGKPWLKRDSRSGRPG